jgi:hypothetical protein
MSHFAKINEDGVVTNILVAEQDHIDTLEGTWVQTSYNTYGGVHYTQQEDGTRIPSADQTKALRKNYAMIGGTYDSTRDAFIHMRKFSSWVLDEESCLWKAPIDMPELTQEQEASGGYYVWNEDVYNADNTQGWVLVGIPE